MCVFYVCLCKCVPSLVASSNAVNAFVVVSPSVELKWARALDRRCPCWPCKNSQHSYYTQMTTYIVNQPSQNTFRLKGESITGVHINIKIQKKVYLDCRCNCISTVYILCYISTVGLSSDFGAHSAAVVQHACNKVMQWNLRKQA